MSISLQKRAEKVGIVLAKRGLAKVPPVRVGCALDVSGSAQHFYIGSRVMQETIDRLMAVALKFDDNGELDAWLFHDGVLPQLPTITESDEGTYVDKVILKQRGLWGATNYAPVLNEVMKFYFGENAPAKSGGMFGGLFGKKTAAAPTGTKKDPAMLLFITDGANSDRSATEQVLRNAEANSPVYFNMVGIGDAGNFRFIEEMADKLGNVGFTNLNDLSISDDVLYDKIVNQEFVDWVKKYTV
jgi:vWA found in TerF C terminus